MWEVQSATETSASTIVSFLLFFQMTTLGPRTLCAAVVFFFYFHYCEIFYLFLFFLFFIAGLHTAAN